MNFYCTVFVALFMQRGSTMVAIVLLDRLELVLVVVLPNSNLNKNFKTL